MHPNRQRARSRLWLLLGIAAAGMVATFAGSSASAASFAATASVTPQHAYLGDSLPGTLYTVTVHNTGTSESIGAVEVGRPGKIWTITACPSAPAGWTAQRSDTMCRFRSASGTADNVAPGGTATFQVRATVAAGNQDVPGSWQVKVSKSDNFDKPSKLVAAAELPPGLGANVYSFEILDAVVDPATTTPGAPCPAPSKSAITASAGHTLVICGRNRTTGTLTPTAAQASLAGTFVGSHGAFTSGAVAPTTSSRILGTWSNVTITAVSGPGKTVIAKVGSSANRTSPLTTLTGYEALNEPPSAVDDSRSTDEETGFSFDPRANDTDPDGDALTVTAVDTTGTAGSVTIGAGGTSLIYDPNGQFESLATGEIGTDTFTYTVTDPYGGSDTATVTITVDGLNDLPTAVDDSPSVGEHSTGATVDVLGNDTDPDASDTLAVSAVDTTGTTGTVTNNGTDVTYDPNGQFESLGVGETASDSFTYTVSDGNGGTDTATVTVTVTGANDPPTANDDAGAAGSGSTGSVVDVLANDTDPDGDTLAVSAVDTTGTAGTVTNNGTDVTYSPNGAFDALPKGETATDTFTYTASDGNGGADTATVTVTITGRNHAPNAVDDAASAAETSDGTAFDVLANDTDLDSDVLTVTAVDTTGTAGTVTNNGTDVTYDPNGQFESLAAGDTATDTFTYTVTDGTETDTATVTVTITGANDPPTATDDTDTAGEDGTGLTVDVLANDTDPDAGDTLTVSAVDTTGTAGTVTNNGTDVTYDPNGQFDALGTGETATDTFTYTASDGNGGTDTATVTVTITGANDPPTAADDSAEISQFGPASPIDVLGNDTDPDATDALTVSAVDSTGTTGTVTNNGTDVSYDPNGQFDDLTPGETATDTFTYTVSDGSGGTDTATVTVTVKGGNVPPVATDDTETVGEDGTAATIDVLANDTDTDTLTVTAVDTTGTTGTITNNGTDVSYDPNGQFESLGAGETATDTFTYTVSDGTDTDTATVTVTITGANDPPTANDDTDTVGEDSGGTILAVLGNDTDADAGDALAVTAVDTTGTVGSVTNNGTDVTYSPNGQFGDLAAGETTTDSYTYTVSDGTVTDTATVTVTITGANDPPTADDDTKSVGEDGPGTVVVVLGNDTDPDASDTLSVSAVDTTGTNGEVVNNGTDVSYDPNGQFETLGAGDTATDTFTYTVSDGNGGTDTATVTMTVTGVDDAPTAVADSFNAIGNTGLFVSTSKPAGQAGKEISGSVLTNDTDPDSPHSSLVVEPVTNGATTQGGTVTIAADGSFSYHPDDGDTALTDTFSYRVCSTSPCSSSVSNDTGTLSLPIAGQVWYVKNNAAAGGDGTSDTPFDTLAEGETASGAGDTTFVFDGDNTSVDLASGYAMDANERLIGEERGLSLDPDGGGSLPSSPLYGAMGGARPTLTASNEDVVTLAAGVVVDGFNLDPSGTGGGIFGGAGTSGVTVAHVHVDDTGTLGTQPGVELNATSGTNSVSDLEVDNTAAGVSLSNAGTVTFASAGTISVSSSAAPALVASGTNLGTSVFDDLTSTGSATGGVALSTTTGSPTFTNLSLTTTSGSTAAFSASSAGQVTVPAAGTANVSATGGPAVLVNGVSNGSELSFDQVSSSGSASAGVQLSGLGTSSFSAASGALSGATTADFDLNGGSGAVSYAGTITDTTGRVLQVQNTSGGTKTFSGGISGSGATSTGVSLTSNTGATVRLTGGLTLSTGANAAFTATGGGTVGVTGAANTIATTTGTALNVTSTSISGTDHLNFRSVAANGATNGIVLNSTGTGRLVVTGNAGTCTVATPTCTGGTIQNTTGDAISLTSTQGVSLTRMRIANNLGNGIKGTSVTGFTLADSVVDNNADNAATDEAGLNFTNLTGTASFLRNEVANSIEDNARIVNSSGALTLAFNDNTVRDTTADAPGNNGLLIQSDGGSVTADVLGSQFLRNRADGLQVVTNGTGSIDVDIDDNGATPSVFDSNNIGVSIAHNSSGSLTFDVKNLTIDGLDSGLSASPINLNLAGSATNTMSGTVSGNTLTNHGSLTGSGIRVISNGAATLTTLIQSNHISGVSAHGIQVLARDGSSTINATIKSNTVVSSGPGALDGIRVDSGAINTDTTEICAELASNSSTTIAGLNGIRVRQRFAGTTFKLAGYAGSATDDAAVVDRLNSTNTLSPGAGADHGGTGFGTIASCPQP